MGNVSQRAVQVVASTTHDVYLPDEIWSCVVQMLEPADVGRLEMVAKQLRSVMLQFEHVIWGQCARGHPFFGGRLARLAHAQFDWKAAYLLSHTCGVRRALLHHRAVHRLALAAAERATCDVGIVGILSDLMWFDDPEVAQTVTTKRPSTAATLVVRDAATMLRFRRENRYSHPVAFIPLDTTGGDDFFDDQGRHLLDVLPPVEHPGCLGYACKLARLRPEDEYLRRTALFTVLRDLTVWRRERDAQEWKRLHPERAHELWFAALDWVPPAAQAAARAGVRVDGERQAGAGMAAPAEAAAPGGTAAPGEAAPAAAPPTPSPLQPDSDDASDVRVVAISALHAFLREAAGRGEDPGIQPETPNEALAARLLRLSGNAVNPVLGAGQPFRVGRLPPSDQMELLEHLERSYAACVSGLQATLLGRRVIAPQLCLLRRPALAR